MTEGTVTLLQFPYSPYNEKARWALDYKRVAHRRRSFLPPLVLVRERVLDGPPFHQLAFLLVRNTLTRLPEQFSVSLGFSCPVPLGLRQFRSSGRSVTRGASLNRFGVSDGN